MTLPSHASGSTWCGCVGCGQGFGGVTLFDQHRRDTNNPDAPRRCLTPAEMEAKGWRGDRRGLWRRPGGYTSGSIRPGKPQKASRDRGSRVRDIHEEQRFSIAIVQTGIALAPAALTEVSRDGLGPYGAPADGVQRGAGTVAEAVELAG
jgi:hypothetical protein